MEDIRIVEYVAQDVLSFFEAVKESRQEISKWLPWCKEDYAFEDAKKWITVDVPRIWQSGKGCEFVIKSESQNKVIGGCCLEQIDFINKNACIGYWVRTSYSGNGIATAACYFLMKHGFEKLGLDQIFIIPSANNPASVGVAEKLPYVGKKRIKDGFKIRGEISDAIVYVLTKKALRRF